jgi:hypothetical protein
MNKPKIKDRIVIWNGEFKGRTGEISLLCAKNTCYVRVDGLDSDFGYQIDELYFQDSPEGYNQPCFQ